MGNGHTMPTLSTTADIGFGKSFALESTAKAHMKGLTDLFRYKIVPQPNTAFVTIRVSNQKGQVIGYVGR
jgi:hypothetical protein